jgi:hypothetical protein
VSKDDWLTSFIYELQLWKPDTPRADALHIGETLYGDGSADPKLTVKRLTSGQGPAKKSKEERSDDWVALFVEELQRLRPFISDSLARTIGVIWREYGHVDPKQAAELYTKSHSTQPPG